MDTIRTQFRNPDSIRNSRGRWNGYVSLVEGHVNHASADDGRDGSFIGHLRKGHPLFGPVATLIPIIINGSGSWQVSDEFSGLPLDADTYSWEVKGKFEIQGYHWLGTEWKEKGITHSSDTYSGTWTIEHKKYCKECDKPIDNFGEHLLATCPDCNASSVYSCTHDCQSSGSTNGYCPRCYTSGVDPNSQDHKERICTRRAWVLRKDWLTGLWYPVRETCNIPFSWCNNPNTCFGGKAHRE